MSMPIVFWVVVAALLIVGAAVIWITRRRPDHLDGFAVVEKNGWSGIDPYPYVYVNANGTARELHPGERDYLETRFQGGDGNRPYVKSRYSQRNGWGEISGFLKRARLPRGIVIESAPSENPSNPLTKLEQIQFMRDKGLVVTENPDGTMRVHKPSTDT
jgi:hypothetical protein